MIRHFTCSVLIVFACLACSGQNAPIYKESEVMATTTALDKELILLAGVRTGDTYYADREEEIFQFHIAYAQQILAEDDVIILTDSASQARYVAALGAEHVAIAPQDDIWMRDFSPQNAMNPVMFRYSAEGQGGGRRGQRDADAVQEVFADILDAANISFGESDLLNDGGNFVDDYAGRAVVSRKFLRDNTMTESQARAALRDAMGANHIAFIEADEQGGLEHADGVVAFIGPNTLVINSYPEDPSYAEALEANLRAGLPGVTLHKIVTPYDGSDVHDARFGSACGLYTNMLVTPQRIYFPQFGIPEDAEALAQMQRWSDKQIIPVDSSGVCPMGGGVRCMSAQFRGETAQKLSAYLRGN